MRTPSALLAVALLMVACGTDPEATSRRILASPDVRAADEVVEEIPTPAPSPTPEPTPSRAVVDATPQPTPLPGSDLALAEVTLTRLATLDAPLGMAVRRGDNALYVGEKGGRIKRVTRSGRVGATVLDISGEVSRGGEQGLLGLAFSPDGSRLYVNFTDRSGDTVVREYDFPGGPVDEGSARVVLEVDQPFGNHNAGHLAFGPDGYLYIGLGDGGSGGDPQGHGQNRNTLLGSMLRIDPRPQGVSSYRVPSDNPFVGVPGARNEIWAYGLRNPWRYSFDSATGDLWIADVGQNAWEEVNFQRADSRGGENYGWNRMEGSHTFSGSEPPNHHPPIYEYANDGDNCSVTGGHVYRGRRIGDLRGAYVFADFCAGRLRAFLEDGGQAIEHRFLGPQAPQISSFGQDHDGELYVLSLAGPMYRIDPA